MAPGIDYPNLRSHYPLSIVRGWGRTPAGRVSGRGPNLWWPLTKIFLDRPSDWLTSRYARTGNYKPRRSHLPYVQDEPNVSSDSPGGRQVLASSLRGTKR